MRHFRMDNLSPSVLHPPPHTQASQETAIHEGVRRESQKNKQKKEAPPPVHEQEKSQGGGGTRVSRDKCRTATPVSDNHPPMGRAALVARRTRDMLCRSSIAISPRQIGRGGFRSGQVLTYNIILCFCLSASRHPRGSSWSIVQTPTPPSCRWARLRASRSVSPR
ncbi:hypothetical protein LX32DRAFT_10993 [Colletotrichum zoysiae]|uniref:Uncharacterized protein n=1 Tax=Colletotrichum zoysiae TaxID=1216348 RepID=A0AAD9HER3_9PEZI|nr:hypothetical protein LX32DRAFT_10993 [Colletotrichum zoysiae]